MEWWTNIHSCRATIFWGETNCCPAVSIFSFGVNYYPARKEGYLRVTFNQGDVCSDSSAQLLWPSFFSDTTCLPPGQQQSLLKLLIHPLRRQDPRLSETSMINIPQDLIISFYQQTQQHDSKQDGQTRAFATGASLLSVSVKNELQT